MKINHRIVTDCDDPFWKEVDRLSLPYEHGDPDNPLGMDFSILNITEDHPAWIDVAVLIRDYGVSGHTISNVFTRSEMDRAEWLVMSALGHHGYPQPEDGFEFMSATYDVSDYCVRCGIGAVQNAPFRLRDEPKAPRSQFLQLNWVFDEYFVREDAAAGLISAGLEGLQLRPVILHSKNRLSAQVKQMEIRTVLPRALDLSLHQAVTCKSENEEGDNEAVIARVRQARWGHVSYCGRVKYHKEHRGPLRFDQRSLIGAPDVVKSFEWFGSGGAAHRLVLVSQRFRRTVQEGKWRGLAFEPVVLCD